ncbi:MAG: hypothetical protein CM1200mP16_03290 [Nitrospina sp.]|nr:MAG: hypothetical protein CM1200mP16_03290 [Nitrospina sp.]
MAGDSTAIGSAIGIAVKRLKDLKSDSKLIILLTDGRTMLETWHPYKQRKRPKLLVLKSILLEWEHEGKAPFLVNSIFGQRYVYQEVDIDEVTLKEISKITGGQFFRATDLESLKLIYKKIDQMEKSEVKIFDHSEYTELFHYFLIPAILILFLEVTLSNTLFRRLP